jgi:hypothetical protein
MEKEKAGRCARHAREKRDLDKMEAFIQRAVRDRAAAEHARCDAANDAAIDAARAAATEAEAACATAAAAARATIARDVSTELVGGGGSGTLAAASARVAAAAAAPMPADTVWAPTVGTRGEWSSFVNDMMRGRVGDSTCRYPLHVSVFGESDLRKMLAACGSDLAGGLDSIVRVLPSADTRLLEAAFGAIGKADLLAIDGADRQADAIVSRAADMLAAHGARGSLGLAAWSACSKLHAATARHWGRLGAHAGDAIVASADGARSVVRAVCGVDAADTAALCVSALKAWPAKNIVDAVYHSSINVRALVGAGVLAVVPDLRVPTMHLPQLLSKIAHDAAAAPRLCEPDTFRRIMALLLEWSSKCQLVAKYTVVLLCDVVAFDASIMGVVAASPEYIALAGDAMWYSHNCLSDGRVRGFALLTRLARSGPAAATTVRESVVLPLLKHVCDGKAIEAPAGADEPLAALLEAVGAAARVLKATRQKAAAALAPAQFARTIRALTGPGGA